MKKSYLLLIFMSFIFITFIITSCSTGRIDSLERKPDEAIIIAKVHVKNQKNGVTSKTDFIFDETTWGTYHVRADSKKYFYMKLPLGNHYLSRISIGDKSINLNEFFITFETKESKIYYIGDLSFELDMGANIGLMFGLIGALAYEGRSVVMPPVAVKNNFDSTTTYFNNLFKNTEPIYPCLIKIDSSMIGKK